MHLRRLIVLITNARIRHQQSPLLYGDASKRRFGFPFQLPHHCANQNDQIKKTKSHVALLFLPEGVGSNETKGDLFTMSKYPAVERYCIQHGQTLLFIAHVLLPAAITRDQTNFRQGKWWSLTGSNRRHPACKAGALPAELRPHFIS
jgi:hypothetical protein